MLKNTLDALSARNVPLQRIVLAGGAKSYETWLRLLRGSIEMTVAHNQGGLCIELERSLPSEVAAISPFVDKLMLLLSECGCVPAGETDWGRRVQRFKPVK